MSYDSKYYLDPVGGKAITNFFPPRKIKLTVKYDRNGAPIPNTIAVLILNIYKGGKKLNANIGDVIEIDIQNPWDHEVTLDGKYLFSGYVYQRASGSPSNWPTRWEKVTPVQRWGFKKYYSMNCNCAVTYCHIDERKCEQHLPGCSWQVATYEIGSEKRDCKSRIGICMFIPKFKQCTWFNPKIPCQDPHGTP